MADVNANIGVHIDTSAALAELKALQRQLANFHSSVSKSSAAAAMAQKGLQTNLLNSINATGKFRAQMGLVRTSTESFTHALEKNKLSMREYFRYAGGSTRTFGKLFKQEFNTIGKVAEERVKKMQTQYIKMGRDASGAMKAISITPNTLNMKDYSTKLAVAAQKQAILNQLLKQGSTNLLNFGKNTQWAGRQLMVGFTVPLLYLGGAAAKVFMDLEKQAVRFKRVYGDMFTTSDETNKALENIQKLAEEFTKYGVAVVDTMEMAANAAAMGKTGADLTAQVAQATRLAVLGGVEQAQALETTISVTNAFGVAAEELAGKINFLNAVENQTVVSIEDLTIAIPKAGPVVKQLGGSVEDLAFFLTAMKEGGINASEGANALKSGLASLINPTKKASDMLAGFGVNIKSIVETNKGNIRQTVIDFSRALDTIDPLNRARAIEQLFGKFQFSRLSTLFQNVTKDGTQAARVLDLAGASVEELAILSERELGVLEDAIGTDFKESVEKLKLALAPIGKEFLKAITPVAKAIGLFLEKFNNLGDGTKKFIIVATTLVGVIGPVLLMTFGLLANGVANIIKLFITMRSGFLRAGANSSVLAQQTQYLNSEQLEAVTVATSLGQAHARLTQSFATETTAVRLLRQAYIDATIAATNFARANPGMMMPGFKPGMKGGKPKGFASGTTGLPGPKGAGDIIPVLGAPGEAIIPAETAQDDRFKPLIAALVSGDIKGYKKGSVGLGDDFSHVGGLKNLNIDELLKNPKITALEKQKLQVYKQILISQGKPTTVGSYGSLAYSFDSQMNKALAKGGVSIDSFEKAWTNRGPEKWMSSNIPPSQAKIVDDAILKQIKASGATKVTDAMIEQTFKNLPAEIKSTSAYSKMNSLHSELGSYGIGRGLGSNPKTSEAILADAKKKGYIKDYKIETRTSDSGVIKTKSLIVTNNDGTQVNLGRGSKTNRQYLPDIQDTRRKSGIINGQTSKAKSPVLSVVGGGASDNRQVAVGKNETILNKKTTSALRSGKGVSVPGIGRFGLIGADLGVPKGQSVTSPGMAVSAVEKQFRAEQKSLRRQIEKVEKERVNALKQETKMIQEKTAVTEKQIPLTKEQLKEQKREVRAQRAQRVGRVAGPLAGIAGMGAMAGYMTGNAKIGNAMMGVSALSSIAPMITNPMSAMVAALTVAVAGIYFWNKNLEQSAKKQAEFVKATSGTTQKMEEVGKITGAVGASQIMERRRERGAFGAYNDVQRAGSMFGDKFLQSDIGKEMAKGFVENMKQFGSKQAASDFALQLSTYVSDGVLNADQAASIAEQIGIQLGNTRYTTQIIGDLRSIIGPNGEDLAKDPLRVRTQIITKATQRTQKELTKLSEAQNKGNSGRTEAAKIAAIGANNLEIIKAQSDATEFMYQKQINSLNKQLETTTNLEKQLQLKQQISDLEADQVRDVSKFNNLFVNTLDNQTKIFRENIMAKSVGSGGKEDAYFDALKASVKDTYKGTAFESMATDALSRLAKLSDQTISPFDRGKTKGGFETTEKAQEFEIQMSLLMKNKILSPEQSNAFLDMFAGKLPELQQALSIGLKAHGPEKTIALLDMLTASGVEKTKAATISTQIIKSNPEQFDKIGEALAALQMLDGHEVNMAAFLESDDAFNKLTALANKLAIVEKMPTPITKESILKFYEEGGLVGTGVTKSQLDILISKWADFNALPDTAQKEAISKFITIYETKFADPTAKLDYMRQEAARMASATGFSSFGQEAEYNRLMSLVGTDPTKLSSEFVAAQVRAYIGDTGKAVSSIPGGNKSGGSGQRDTTLDDLLRKLKMTRDAGIDAEGGIGELNRIFKESGGDITKFTGIIQQLNNMGANREFLNFIEGLDNKTQAAYLNVKELKKGVVELTPVGEKAMKLFQEAGLGGFAADADTTITAIKMQTEGFIRLREAGVSVEDSLEMMSDEQFMYDLQQAKSIELQDELIAKYYERMAAEQKLLEDTDPEKAFDIQMNKAMKYYDFLEKEAKAAAQPEIDRVNALIDANEKLIDTKQRSIEMDYDRPIEKLNQDLAIINKAADGINKKYDEQEKALEKISSLNQEIAEQEKGRLTLADALTSGDISAAARAAQEMRATAAANAIQRSSSALQIARESEVSALTAGGLTRAQIEEKIYSLEQLRLPIIAQITALQDKNYNYSKNELEPLTEALNARIKNIDTARTAWENQQLAIQAAAFEADKTNARFKVGEGIVAAIKKLWDDIKDKNITLSVNTVGTPLVTSTSTSGISTTGRGGGFFRIQDRMYGGKILPMAMGGMVPKYMVAGGGIGSDTVPAMLTPGEFVMNKQATKSFGPLLSMLNESKYPSMIGSSYDGKGSGGNRIATSVSDNSSNVYNYSVGITVPQSNANPNDIARAVIGQIKYIDNQRIRGQR